MCCRTVSCWVCLAVVLGVFGQASAGITNDPDVVIHCTLDDFTTSDDGVRLWLDGRLLLRDWRSHGSTDDLVKVDLIAGQAYLLQMEWYENTGSAIARLWWQSDHIRREIIPAGPLQLPVRATSPYPANTAVNTSQTLPLRWRAGDAAKSHDVYLGEDANAVGAATPADAAIYKGNQADASFDPGPLEGDKTYYWRVDEVNQADANSPWKGAVWSFTAADFIVVDDFEWYTDDMPDRIYRTWIDGWSISGPWVSPGNATCMTVGYIEAPFAEQKIVHGGGQSMPLDYNNVVSLYYSEAERTWATPQDWTINSMNTLTLCFKAGEIAKAAPTPDPLYIVITDASNHTAVVKHPDTNAVLQSEWQEWKIPLADITAARVNVTKIKKMHIGIGDRNNPRPGGAGVLFIDDIRVIKAPAK